MQAYILLGTVALLIVTLFELVQSRKRQEIVAEYNINKMRSLYQANHALENKAQELVAGFTNE
jgi:hypothetical protein